MQAAGACHTVILLAIGVKCEPGLKNVVTIFRPSMKQKLIGSIIYFICVDPDDQCNLKVVTKTQVKMTP